MSSMLTYSMPAKHQPAFASFNTPIRANVNDQDIANLSTSLALPTPPVPLILGPEEGLLKLPSSDDVLAACRGTPPGWSSPLICNFDCPSRVGISPGRI